MIHDVNVTKTISVPPARAWTAISGIGGLDRWFPVIAGCRVEGTGVGAVRVLRLGDGAEMRDRIEEIDHGNRRFRYDRTDHPFPVRSYLGTVEVRDASGGGAEISWTVVMELGAEARDAVSAFVAQALSDGIDGLERELGAPKT